MYKLLKKYSDENPERFNKDFIMSRDDTTIIDQVRDIFKSLEILQEVKVEEVTLETDESTLGPIKKGIPKQKLPTEVSQTMLEDMRRKVENSSGKGITVEAYKGILQSRLNKIHYKIRLTPTEKVKNEILLEDGCEREELPVTSETFYREGDIYINKLVDKCFYINEGIRYYLIYQIVDNTTYSTKEAVSLKSLVMPITLVRKEHTAYAEFTNTPYVLPSFDLLLFKKKMSPILYFFAKEAYNEIVRQEMKNKDFERSPFRDENLPSKVFNYLGVDFKFSDDLHSLSQDEDRVVFQVKSDKTGGVYVSVKKESLENHYMTKAVLGCILSIDSSEKKKKIVFSKDQLESPMFWIDRTAAFFTKNTDLERRFEKVKATLFSLARLIDDATRKVLRLKDEDKQTSLSVIRYLMRDFERLLKEDAQDLNNKRLRLFEYQLFPLRLYISDQVYRVLNSPSRSKNVLDRMFSSLKPMYVIKQTVTNELLRYYNGANEINLFSALLKFSYTGAQAIAGKNVSVFQRDIHPSQTGRLSLIAASASNPGLSGNLVPWVETFGKGFFSEDESEKKI